MQVTKEKSKVKNNVVDIPKTKLKIILGRNLKGKRKFRRAFILPSVQKFFKTISTNAKFSLYKLKYTIIC